MKAIEKCCAVSVWGRIPYDGNGRACNIVERFCWPVPVDLGKTQHTKGGEEESSTSESKPDGRPSALGGGWPCRPRGGVGGGGVVIRKKPRRPFLVGGSTPNRPHPPPLPPPPTPSLQHFEVYQTHPHTPQTPPPPHPTPAHPPPPTKKSTYESAWESAWGWMTEALFLDSGKTAKEIEQGTRGDIGGMVPWESVRNGGTWVWSNRKKNLVLVVVIKRNLFPPPQPPPTPPPPPPPPKPKNVFFFSETLV